MTQDETNPCAMPESAARGVKRRKWVAMFIGTALACILIVPMFSAVLVFDGRTRCMVTVVVIEHDSSLPVKNAEVRIIDTQMGEVRQALGEKDELEWKAWMESREMQGKTGDDGAVCLRAECGMGGSSTIFGGRKGRYVLNHTLEISHPGHESLRIPLASLLGQNRFPLRNENKLTVRVWLEPKKVRVASIQKPQP